MVEKTISFLEYCIFRHIGRADLAESELIEIQSRLCGLGYTSIALSDLRCKAARFYQDYLDASKSEDKSSAAMIVNNVAVDIIVSGLVSTARD